MSDITLLRAQRQVMQRLTDLCLDVSLAHPDYVAEFIYSGHVHALDVALIPRAHLSAEFGGDESYRDVWRCHISLPGNPRQLDTSEVLTELNQACAHLAGLMGE